MYSITDISAIVGVTGVFIGIIYYVIQIRYQTKIMRTDALVRLYSTTNSEDVLENFWKASSIKVNDYEDYVKQYGSPFSENEGSSIHKALMKTIGIYDLVGTLLYKKLIDIDIVYTVLGFESTKMLHQNLYPVILGIRRESNEPGAYAGFDYLVSELSKKEPQLRKNVEAMLDKSKENEQTILNNNL